uniref:NADH-ubiquinone oxidoreductase chain 6 n=1 Tax=Epigonichthys cultellus TaxID=1355229 RepID=A0A182C2S4_9BRAN|nr:NADH dehydrogenase subunit 6 [Epigonichthys cultellus]
MLQMFLIFCILLTSVMIIRSTTPYFGALATAGMALTSALLLLECGKTFPAMILMLIYLGGMLVVFIYSTAYSADLMPLPINMTTAITTATLGTAVITSLSPNMVEYLCENKPWESYNSNNNYMIFDLYERGWGTFVIATMILTVLLFAILEIVSQRQSTMKWYVHSTN